MFDFNKLPKNKRHIRKVQLGAGNSNSTDCINTDFYQTENIDLVLNLSEPFPFDSNTIEEFYSHHVLEHIKLIEIDSLFREIYRCLKPGGKFKSILPDFERAAEQFLQGKNIANAIGSIWGNATLGWLPEQAHVHMYGWTKNTLKQKLEEHNFRITELKQEGEEITALVFTAEKG